MTVTVEHSNDAAELSANPVLMIAAGQTDSTGVVTLTALQDADIRTEIVELRGTPSDDSQFVSVNYGAQVIIIDDDDMRDVQVSVTPAPTQVFEGGTSTFTANLNQPLSDEVTITVGVDEAHPDHTAAADHFTLSANRTLTIPAGSMHSTDVVTLTASNDDYYYGPSRTVVLDFSATGIDQKRILDYNTWIILEDEAQPRVTLSVAPASIAENGGQSMVAASLNTIVESDVEVTVTTAPVVAAEADDFTQSATLLTIPAGRKNSTGNLTINAVDDAIDGPDKHFVVQGTVQVVGMEQSGLVWFPYAEGLTIRDDDEALVVLSTSSLDVAEGSSNTYTVVLGSQPTAEVTIDITGHSGTDLTLAPASAMLTFTTSNWSEAQTVTVEADQDDDAVDDTATLVHTASGGGYDSVTGDLPVTVTEDDTAQVTGVMLTAGDARLEVEWTAVANATGYKVQWKSGGQDYDPATRQATVSSGSTTSHQIDSLANGTEYTVQVIAVRSGANDGPPSDEVMGTPKVPNTSAVGLPMITGTAEVGETLTAETSGITDVDGLINVSYRYRWIRVDGNDETDIADATDSTYVLVTDDAGTTLKVEVTFTDDADHEQTLVSAPTQVIQDLRPYVTLASPNAYHLETLGLHANEATGRPVTLVVEFSAAVTGLEAEEFVIENGEVTDVYWVNCLLRNPSLERWCIVMQPADAQDERMTLTIPENIADGGNQPALEVYYAVLRGTAPTGTFTTAAVEPVSRDFLARLTFDQDMLEDAPGTETLVFPEKEYLKSPDFVVPDEAVARITLDGFTHADDGSTIEVRIYPPGLLYQEPMSVVLPAGAALSETGYPNPELKLEVLVDTFTGSTLQDLALTDLEFSPALDFATIRDHAASVGNEVVATEVTATPTVADAIVEIEPPDADPDTVGHQVALDVGDTTVTVTVKDANSPDLVTDGSVNKSWQQTYEVVITRAPAGTAATGQPAIEGTGAAQVGVELTATTSGIMDADGKTNADNGVTGYAYTYQWILVDGTTETDIAGETGSTYTPVATDVGHRIKVRVSFTDDAGNPEEPLPSYATVAAVVAAAEDCAVDRPGNDWCATMTVGVSRTGSIIVYGFLADSFGQLDYTTIDYGPSYGVEWITANETGGNDYVAVSLSARVPLGSVFNLGGREFTADADSEQGTLGLYNWNLPTDFGWIDGQKVTVSANLSPAPESATVDGTTLVLTHAEDLDTGSTPAAGSYTVKLGGSAGPTVSSVAVDARTVTLTLATAITAADTDVTVTYTAPVSSPLQDVSSLDAPDSEDFPVTNNTGATNTIPVVDNPIPDRAATVGMAFSYEFPAETFNDDDGDTLTYMATKDDDNALPSWLTFDDTTRTFSGTPQGGDVGTVTVKVTASDGEGATVSDEFDIVVSAANSAPTSADNTVTTDEDTAYTFAAADFNFDDTDSGDALASVTLVTLPAAGALELDGAAVSVDQVVAEVDIVKLTFTPALNANGLGYASFTFKVNDGTADSVDAYTMTVNVTPVNDAATGAPEITGTPQVGQALTAGMDTIADAEDLPTTTFPLGYSFQWVRVAGSTETDLTGETNITYSPASADEGNTIKVKVSFTDGAGNSETVPSDAVGPVVPAAGACITGHDWCATMTVEVETDEQGDITFVGFSHTGLGTLNPNTISYGSKHYETLSVRWTPDSPIADLEIIFEVTAQNAGDLPSGSVFGFDEIERTEEAGKSVYNNPGEYAWDDLPTDFGWIDGQKVTVSANLSPAPESATVDGTTLVLTHAEDLDTGSTPAAGSYTVKLGGSAGPTVSSVAVDARTVTLTLATAITAADTDVTVDYDAPVSSPLQDVSGLDAPDFEDFEVTNNTATSNDATLSALTVNDGTTDHTIDLTTTPYTQTVGNAVTTVTLTATPTHTGAEVSAVTLGGSAIADTVFTDGITVPSLVEGGANVIVVTVTAEDGTTMQTYTVTITDDDESMFTVIAAPTSIAEDGGATTVTVSTGGVTFADDRQIALTLTGTATKGTDYTVDSETLTLTAGETSVATMVTAVQDAVDEEDETIDITAEGAQTRVTITDDDESMFTVIAAPTSIAEDGGATTVTVSTGGVTFADDRQIALTLTGTATKGTDYTVDSETLTLTAGTTSVTTMVTAVQDAVDDDGETIVITAEGAQTRVTITDDDESMFTVIAVPTSIAEDGGATTVTVSTGGVTFADDRQIALTLTGTATKGTDYTVDSETLTLTAGTTSVTTMVTAVQDAVDEEDETIDITAEGAQTRVTITDDDESMFTVIAAPTSIAEDGGATTVTVSTGGVTFADDRQIALTLTGTATKGTDYTVDSETLTLTAGTTSVTTMVTAVQDAVDDDGETIVITAEGAQTRVTITDDDESMFTVIAAPTSIAEDGGATTVTVSTGGVTFADDRQIALTLTGTATKGTDYTVDSETLTLTAGETSVATMVTAVDDAVDEEDETIDITAEGAQTRVTITDDDESMFTVIAAPTSIAEDGGATTVTVSTGGVTFADDRQIALTLTGTATKGTDYTVDSETLTLTAGETSVATMVTAVQDAVDEEDETIDITAEGAQTRVTITDDDESMFTVIAAPTSIAEDGGATTVTVSTGGVTFADDRQIALTLTGTATKGTDYTVDSETLTLTAGETSVATMVTAVQDAVDEEDETIVITAEGAQETVTITTTTSPCSR